METQGTPVDLATWNEIWRQIHEERSAFFFKVRGLMSLVDDGYIGADEVAARTRNLILEVDGKVSELKRELGVDDV